MDEGFRAGVFAKTFVHFLRGNEENRVISTVRGWVASLAGAARPVRQNARRRVGRADGIARGVEARRVGLPREAHRRGPAPLGPEGAHHSGHPGPLPSRRAANGAWAKTAL